MGLLFISILRIVIARLPMGMSRALVSTLTLRPHVSRKQYEVHICYYYKK